MGSQAGAVWTEADASAPTEGGAALIQLPRFQASVVTCHILLLRHGESGWGGQESQDRGGCFALFSFFPLQLHLGVAPGHGEAMTAVSRSSGKSPPLRSAMGSMAGAEWPWGVWLERTEQRRAPSVYVHQVLSRQTKVSVKCQGMAMLCFAPGTIGGVEKGLERGRTFSSDDDVGILSDCTSHLAEKTRRASMANCEGNAQPGYRDISGLVVSDAG
ncbi:hypothetical protein Q7P35_006656 [Cladosporium inversicolor]